MSKDRTATDPQDDDTKPTGVYVMTLKELAMLVALYFAVGAVASAMFMWAFVGC